MTSPEDFVDGDSIDGQGLALTLVSSLILVIAAGFSSIITSLWAALGNGIELVMGWFASFAIALLETPGETFDRAWLQTGEAFPLAGPLDFMAGVAVLALFFYALNWMFQQLRGYLQW